jgi:phosphohistidine phosphatase
VKNEISVQDGLAPNDNVNVIKERIISAGQDLMIVGHLPFLSKLASLLLTGSESSETVAFKQGSIVCLRCEDENQWQINWMITPELLV